MAREERIAVSPKAQTEDRIRARVREVVYRTLGRPAPSSAPRRGLLTEADVMGLPFRSELVLPPGAMVTPLARQAILERQIRLRAEAPGHERAPAPSSAPGGGRATVAVGSDHGGFAMKEDLRQFLTERGQAVIDCGAPSDAPVDYPDYALAVAELVASGRAEKGILIDGAGIGSSMAANKVPGVRAALCYDLATAVNSREHNDANVLTLGAGLIGASLARQIVGVWLETRFAGGRHARRVDKIKDIERRFSRR